MARDGQYWAGLDGDSLSTLIRVPGWQMIVDEGTRRMEVLQRKIMKGELSEKEYAAACAAHAAIGNLLEYPVRELTRIDEQRSS